MSDHLEDFIKSNRDAFDDKEPPAGAWKNIERSMNFPAKPWYDSLVLWRAAAVVFMAITFYLLIPKNDSSNENSKVAVSEFNDVEAFYNSQISQKVALIQEFSKDETNDELTQDFQQLEAMYNVLKEEWKVRPSKKVKDALVLNLLVRINLLNQQLHRLEEELKSEPTSDSEEKKAEA